MTDAICERLGGCDSTAPDQDPAGKTASQAPADASPNMAVTTHDQDVTVSSPLGMLGTWICSVHLTILVQTPLLRMTEE
ncbi:MAG: hypothetical protein ACC726_08530 [Chloroflexota bacterium]